MGVAKNGWFSSVVNYAIGGSIGLALILGARWIAAVNNRLAALEARPPVRREWVIEKIRGIDPYESELFFKHSDDESADDEYRHPDEDLISL